MVRRSRPAVINVHQAKTSLSKLLARVERGEEIIIARSGKPVARLVPAQPPRGPRTPGSAKHLIRSMSDDFNQTPEEILRDFGV
ncbi:MAG TPA: type II toxin-antitoxin system prevent-host-death family antitoxin [Tepidisphaeraceae bacterium]|jgi:prevent-host-death family protein|nr:type II toxin-antitoxin system prevent-host-death family antitoxin [Tepidisphaeraceae bacterium]